MSADTEIDFGSSEEFALFQKDILFNIIEDQSGSMGPENYRITRFGSEEDTFAGMLFGSSGPLALDYFADGGWLVEEIKFSEDTVENTYPKVADTKPTPVLVDFDANCTIRGIGVFNDIIQHLGEGIANYLKNIRRKFSFKINPQINLVERSVFLKP